MGRSTRKFSKSTQISWLDAPSICKRYCIHYPQHQQQQTNTEHALFFFFSFNKVSVFKPTKRSLYLNVTTSNIATIVMDDGTVLRPQPK
jgi:hypothetical protein